MAARIVSVFKKLSGKRMALYFGKAFLITVLLYLSSKAAPALPLPVMLFLVVAFAAVALIGSLHFVVMRRLLRRFKLRENGDLARMNKKWVVCAALLFLASLVSALAFFLQAPTWGTTEWTLTVLAIPVYYIVFLGALRLSRRQLADGFDKASAMKWAFWITGALVCVLYVLCVMLFELEQEPEMVTMRYAFDQVQLPYADSPCGLFADLEALTSFLEGLRFYALHNVAQVYSWVAVVVDAIVFAAAFFGLSSQFCYCMLDNAEVRAEFQELPPVNMGNASEANMLARYFVVLASIAFVFCGVLVVANGQIENERTNSEFTSVGSWVEARKQNLITLYDAKIEIEAAKIDMLNALMPELNEYYDKCTSNVGKYIDEHVEEEKSWFESVGDWFGSIFDASDGDVGEAKQEFIEQISEGTDWASVSSTYSMYRDILSGKTHEFGEGLHEIAGVESADVELPEKLDPWLSLSDEKVSDVLMNKDLSRDKLKEQIIGLIDSAHQDVLDTLSVLDVGSGQQGE